MKQFFSPRAHDQEWHATLGRSRDSVIGSLLHGGWFTHPSKNAVFHIEELHSTDFALRFSCFPTLNDFRTYQRMCCSADRHCDCKYAFKGPVRFDVILNYRGHREAARIKDVYFDGVQYQGLGRNFLSRVIHTALELNCQTVAVDPGRQGSWYWTRRGAIIQSWPEHDNRLNDRFYLLVDDKIADWSAAEHRTFISIFESKNVAGLNEIVGWDHVSVRNGGCPQPFRTFFLDDISLGACSFELFNPLTQRRLREKVGLDVASYVSKDENSRSSIPLALPVRDRNELGLTAKVGGPAF